MGTFSGKLGTATAFFPRLASIIVRKRYASPVGTMPAPSTIKITVPLLGAGK